MNEGSSRAAASRRRRTRAVKELVKDNQQPSTSKEEGGTKHEARHDDSSTAASTKAQDRSGGRCRVLCVGCGGAIMRRDAADVAAAMKDLGHASDNVTLLAGRDASREAIGASLAEIFSESLPDDEVVSGNAAAAATSASRSKEESAVDTTTRNNIAIYFSCHARFDDQDELWLLTEEETHHDRAGTRRPRQVRRREAGCYRSSEEGLRGVSASELRKACLRSTTNILLILDCCYAGAVATDNLGKLSRKWRGDDAPGRIFLTSSGDSQVTHYHQGARNSPLTASILRILAQSSRRERSNSVVLTARSLAQEVKSYFATKPYWGNTVRAEERGGDFSLVCRTK